MKALLNAKIITIIVGITISEPILVLKTTSNFTWSSGAILSISSRDVLEDVTTCARFKTYQFGSPHQVPLYVQHFMTLGNVCQC